MCICIVITSRDWLGKISLVLPCLPFVRSSCCWLSKFQKCLADFANLVKSNLVFVIVFVFEDWQGNISLTLPFLPFVRCCVVDCPALETPLKVATSAILVNTVVAVMMMVVILVVLVVMKIRIGMRLMIMALLMNTSTCVSFTD